MDNTTTNVQGDRLIIPTESTNGTLKKRKSISYKSELEKMKISRDKWRVRTIALIVLYVISLIIKIIAS